LKLLLFETIDEFDGGEEPDAPAVVLDGLDADRSGPMSATRRARSASRSTHQP
jgi:hypothetical protein